MDGFVGEDELTLNVT